MTYDEENDWLDEILRSNAESEERERRKWYERGFKIGFAWEMPAKEFDGHRALSLRPDEDALLVEENVPEEYKDDFANGLERGLEDEKSSFRLGMRRKQDKFRHLANGAIVGAIIAFVLFSLQ